MAKRSFSIIEFLTRLFVNDSVPAKERFVTPKITNSDIALARLTFEEVTRRLVIHDYLWDNHNTQMLVWREYHRNRDQLKVLADRYVDNIEFCSIADMNSFDETVALRVFKRVEWEIVKQTLDVIGKAHADLNLPFVCFDGEAECD